VGFFHEGQFIRAEQPAFLLYAASHAPIPPRRAKIQARTQRSSRLPLASLRRQETF
jgi:hypothetical protein